MQLMINIARPDREAEEAARERCDHLLKPPGSLGLLEEIAIRLAGILRTPWPQAGEKAVLVMAADNGVTEEGVSSAPKSFTAIQTRHMLLGRTGVAVLAKEAKARLCVIDVGIDGDVEIPGLIQEKIRQGTGNIIREDAMTEEEMLRAIDVGRRQVRILKEQGITTVGIGEMGIGNTTTTAAILHALRPDVAATQIVGKGAGLTESDRQKKIQVVEASVARAQLKPDDPLTVLQRVGGLDIAAMTGAYLEAAEQGMPAVIDGVISMAAAYLAWKICPEAKAYFFASHRSAEPAYEIMCGEMGMEPPLHMHMRLGEGSGCPLFFSIMDAACAMLNHMATFEEAGTDGEFLIDIREL